MLDSGSSISLIRSDALSTLDVEQHLSLPPHNLVTASGQPLEVVDCVQLAVRLNNAVMTHHFSVVNHLITIIILGVDFLQGHSLVLTSLLIPSHSLVAQK